jgi:hypothetical protein
LFAHTVVDPRAMVVKHADTFAACVAVTTSLTSYHLTLKAYPLSDLIMFNCLILGFLD